MDLSAQIPSAVATRRVISTFCVLMDGMAKFSVHVLFPARCVCDCVMMLNPISSRCARWTLYGLMGGVKAERNGPILGTCEHVKKVVGTNFTLTFANFAVAPLLNHVVGPRNRMFTER